MTENRTRKRVEKKNSRRHCCSMHTNRLLCGRCGELQAAARELGGLTKSSSNSRFRSQVKDVFNAGWSGPEAGM